MNTKTITLICRVDLRDSENTLVARKGEEVSVTIIGKGNIRETIVNKPYAFGSGISLGKIDFAKLDSIFYTPLLQEVR